MRINFHSFDVFERDNFIYRKNTEGSEKVRKEYKTAWDEWKKIVNVALSSSDKKELAVENTENWQNSGNLSDRFWSRIKDKKYFERPSCIAAMISKDNLRVYLEWHGYKNESLHEERKVHNSWVFSVDEWIKENRINTLEYKVWTNKDLDGDFDKYVTLQEFINSSKTADRVKSVVEENNKNWIRVGKAFPKSEVLENNNITQEMGKTIKDLTWIYKIAVDDSSNIEARNNSTVEIIRENPEIFLTNNELINHIHSYIKSKGFYYKKEEVMNLFLSIKTKPFVILFGISGTGKTKMVQWFAESVGATEENGQFALIPIRPDWNDGSDLLGYVDIKGEFKEGPLTKVIKRAEENPNLPYFVLLDEMNLARVEYYFSDILSVMESRKWKNGKMVSSNLLSEETAGLDLKLPNNLYIIGTVNMDETTHPFSKKVLDRANTIEFNRVELANLDFLLELNEIEPAVIGNNSFASRYLHLKDLYQKNTGIVERVTEELVKMNESLQLINAHVGYRVRDEICFYMAYNVESQLMNFQEALDHCILQKVLPRIAGSDSRVDQLLRDLYKQFTNKQFEEDLDLAVNHLTNANYPHSAAKVVEMLRRLREDGFTSFWIS